jgi:hypothetical protein
MIGFLQRSFIKENGDVNKARTYVDKSLELSKEKLLLPKIKIINPSKTRRQKELLKR